jgi:hypothetical protein
LQGTYVLKYILGVSISIKHDVDGVFYIKFVKGVKSLGQTVKKYRIIKENNITLAASHVSDVLTYQ